MASIRKAANDTITAKPTTPDDKPHFGKPWTLYDRLRLGLRLWALKIFVILALGSLRLLKGSRFRKIAPTYTKTYSIRPSLECRVFLPANYKTGTKLPLYIDIHGGGFALCDATTDDHYSRHFADKFGFCVVSINYRKAPQNPFPTAVYDCAELARAILADGNLPVDYTKTVMGGFSAGGNLTLAVAQLDGVRDRIKVLVPVYPAVDFTGKSRGEMRPNKAGKQDLLKNMSDLFTWGYVSEETDRKDKLLSPIYASREELPQKMFFVGAEYDFLHHEANVMAKRLAGIEHEQDLGPQWSRNGIRWENVPDVQHGFTHVEEKGEAEVERNRVCEELYQRIADWIYEEGFKA